METVRGTKNFFIVYGIYFVVCEMATSGRFVYEK